MPSKKVKIVESNDAESNPQESKPEELKSVKAINDPSESFAVALKEQITKRKKTRSSARLLKLIDGPRSNRRQRVLARLERHAKVHLKDEGMKGVDDIQDWLQVGEKDWSKFFDSLLDFITKILPLILKLFGM